MEQRSTGRVARDAAVEQTAATLAYFALIAVVSLAVVKRDALGRLWLRLFERTPGPDELAEVAALADLRRDISAWEHRGPECW